MDPRIRIALLIVGAIVEVIVKEGKNIKVPPKLW